MIWSLPNPPGKQASWEQTVHMITSSQWCLEAEVSLRKLDFLHINWRTVQQPRHVPALNRQPFHLRDDAQTTEPHQSGQYFFLTYFAFESLWRVYLCLIKLIYPKSTSLFLPLSVADVVSEEDDRNKAEAMLSVTVKCDMCYLVTFPSSVSFS